MIASVTRTGGNGHARIAELRGRQWQRLAGEGDNRLDEHRSANEIIDLDGSAKPIRRPGRSRVGALAGP